MRKALVALVTGCLTIPALAGGPIYSNGDPGDPTNPRLSTGPTTLSGVPAPAGTTWSEVANEIPTESNTVAGYSIYRNLAGTTHFRGADDFTVPPGFQWQVDSVSTWAYRTGNPTSPSPFLESYFQIWDGRPGDTGSSVIFGDLTTNRLMSTTFGSMYRIFNTVAPPPGTAPGTTRPLFRNESSLGVLLDPGTYWVDWTYRLTTDTFTSFSPSITIAGTRGLPGWNARQWQNTLWVDLIDAGNPATAPDVPQDFPFILHGVIIPEPGSLILLGLGGALLLRRR